MSEIVTDLVGLLEARRKLAAAMLEAHAAKTFENPISEADAEFLRTELAECDARLAELRKD